MAQHGITPIDLLVVNLYPFEQTVAQPDCTLEDAIENIDIGGPALRQYALQIGPAAVIGCQLCGIVQSDNSHVVQAAARIQRAHLRVGSSQVFSNQIHTRLIERFARIRQLPRLLRRQARQRRLRQRLDQGLTGNRTGRQGQSAGEGQGENT